MRAGVSDAGVQLQEPTGSVGATVCRGLDESSQGIVEADGCLRDTLAELVPGGESVLACDHRLRVMEGEGTTELLAAGAGECWKDPESAEGGRVPGPRGAKQFLRLASELIEIGVFGQGAVGHKVLHAQAAVRKLASTENDVPSPLVMMGGLCPSRGPASAPKRRGSMPSPARRVKPVAAESRPLDVPGGP